MEDTFGVEVEHGGRKYTFEGRLATVGFTHRFYVLINGLEVTWEPDEERNYRAMLSAADQHKATALDRELIKAVGDKIQEA
jgi:hypothetical protein